MRTRNGELPDGKRSGLQSPDHHVAQVYDAADYTPYECGIGVGPKDNLDGAASRGSKIPTPMKSTEHLVGSSHQDRSAACDPRC